MNNVFDRVAMAAYVKEQIDNATNSGLAAASDMLSYGRHTGVIYDEDTGYFTVPSKPAGRSR